MSENPALLDGVRVIDLTRVLAGPYCAQLLGDMGADVIKVEVPERGDDTRQWGPPWTEDGLSAYFVSANRNKRSMTLNLKSDEGKAILRSLLAEADVLVENFRTGTLEKFGFSYEDLQAIRPGLIYATVTGYGYTGPYANRPGYDFMVQAMGGFMYGTGEPAPGEPTRAGVAIADLATGMFACNAICAALFKRQQTGEGQRIDMALLDSMVGIMSYVASNYLVSGEVPERIGNAHPSIVPYQQFQAKDIAFIFGAGNDGQWAKFCNAVEHPEWIDDPRFKTNPDRVANRAAAVEVLSELFATRNANEWMELFNEVGLPSAPINSMDRVFDDPQVKARGLKVEGDIPLVRSPLHIPTAPTTVRHLPPQLGAHTDEVLGDLLGFDAEKLAQLRKDGVI